MLFLTDGEATIGVTSGDTILSNAKKALGSASLFGLAFGDDADFLLLKRLALDNRGVARMVYEDADAALQLKGFYDEVASPLLSDIQLSYLDDQAFDVTRSLFPNYFQGSELVVSGRVKPGVKDLKVSVSATDSKQRMKLENDVLVSQGNESTDSLSCSGDFEGLSSFVHRLWAYFTIKELLLAKLNATDPATQRLLTDKATNLSLKYNFVTPVTSLVVVKPDVDEATQSPTTQKPTIAATITTTATTTATTKASGAAKKPGAPTNPKHNKLNLGLPQPPPNALQPNRKTAAPPSKKAATTSTPPSAKTAPAPLSGKKPTTAHNDSKLASPHLARKIPTSLLNALKTAPPPAPGKVSAPLPGAKKRNTHTASTTVPTVTTTISTQLSSVRSSPAPLPGTAQTAVGEEDGNTSAPDAHQPESTATLTQLSSTLTPPTPAPAPAVDNNNTDLSIATLVSATFAPMPGVTDGPQLWEAAGLLGRSQPLVLLSFIIKGFFFFCEPGSYKLTVDWSGFA